MHSLRPSTSVFRALASAAFVFLLASLLVGCTGYTRPLSQASSQAPSLALSAQSLTFKAVVVGQTQSQTLKISNSGDAPLRLTVLAPSNPQFSINGPSIPATILPSGNLSYTVTFSPASVGSSTATLDIASNAANGIVALPVAGTGEKAFANLNVSPASINFGNLNLKAKGTQNVTLQNTGDVSMTIQGVTVAGAGFGYASLSPGVSLSPNQSLTFQVWFAPQAKGPASATVSFLSPSLSSPATLNLSGDGIVAGSAPPPTSPAPGPAVQHTVHLNWNPSSSAIVGYRVYRSQNSGNDYKPLTGLPLIALSYADATVASGKTYYYVVTSVDASGDESPFSNQVQAVIPSP